MQEKNLPVPYKSQWDDDAKGTQNDCGPASIAMILNYFGENVTTDQVFQKTGAGKGLISVAQMQAAIAAFGYTSERRLNQTFNDVKKLIDSNIPFIALVHYGSLKSTQDKKFKSGHWFTVVGYRDDGYFVNDPNFWEPLRKDGDHHFYTKGEFEQSWTDCVLDSNQPNSILVINPKQKPPTAQESAQNDWNGVLSHFDVKDAKELIEMVDKELQFLDDERTKSKQLEDIFNKRRETLAQNLGTVNDWDEIIVASGRFKSLDEQNQDLQIKLEKEQQAHKQTVLDYQAKLEALSKEMDEMKKRHETQIENMQAKVDKEIADLKKAREQYESVSKIISWFKGILKKG